MKTVVLQCVNILLICFGCAMIWLMSMHHSLIIVPIIYSPDDGFSRGWFYGYFLVQPQIKALYAAGLLLLVGKDFFLKKPLKFKVKTNLVLAFVLPVLLLTQVIGWWHYM